MSTISNSKQVPLKLINTASICLIHEDTNHNDEELEKIKKLVEENKKNGYKIPLLATVFLLFYNSGKKTLKKSEAYALMEKEALNNKNKIISSPTERYCMISQKNYKSKIKDILKKKKWFSRKVNDSGEIEYTLNPGVVASVVPKISSYLKVLVKNQFLFKSQEELEEQDNSDIIKDELTKEENEKDENNTKTGEAKDKKGKKKYNKKKMMVKKGRKLVIKGKNKGKNKKGEDFDILIDEDTKIEKISSNESDDSVIIQQIDNKVLGPKTENSLFLSPLYLKKKRKSEKNKFNKKRPIKKKLIKSKKVLDSSSSLEGLENFQNKNKLSISTKEKINQEILNNQITFIPPAEIDLKTEDTEKEKGKENDKESEKEDISLNNKIESAINIGDAFIKLLKSKKFSELTSKKLDSIRKSIEKKEKEIKEDIQFMEKIIQREEKVKSTNIREIDKKLKELKINHEEYKEKIELLIDNKKKYDNSENKEKEEKEALNIYNENSAKCSEISEKMLSNFSLIFNEYINIGDLLNLLYIDEKGENYFDMKSITNIEDYGNLFKKVMDSTMIEVNTKDNNNDSMNIDMIKGNSKMESNNESNAGSPLAAGVVNNNLNYFNEPDDNNFMSNNKEI